MTIDYGYPTGPPEPISPLWWMGEVLRYALTNIPEYKLQSAFPMYGYDWIIPTHETKALSAQSAQNLSIAMGAEIYFDTTAASLPIRIGEKMRNMSFGMKISVRLVQNTK